MSEIRDCPDCGTPLLTLQGFDGIVVSHECSQCDWRTPMRTLVDAVLSTLWERRPYKHDLAAFVGEEPGGYEEMLQEMESCAAAALKKYKVELAP